jgi:hypothetical protein
LQNSFAEQVLKVCDIVPEEGERQNGEIKEKREEEVEIGS